MKDSIMNKLAAYCNMYLILFFKIYLLQSQDAGWRVIVFCLFRIHHRC